LGKWHIDTSLFDETRSTHFFEVIVSIHGRNPHKETYSMRMAHVLRAKELGYLNEKQTYLDWKPLNKKTNFEGGIFQVKKFSKDDKYIYAFTDNTNVPTFSLPMYLEKHIKGKEILVGHRESNF